MATLAKSKRKKPKQTRARKIKPRLPDATLTADLDIGGPTIAGTNVTPDNSLRFAPVYRAVSLISQTVGTLPIHVRKKSTTSSGRPSREVMTTGAAAEFLRSPNPEQTAVMFFENVCKSLGLWGNFIGEIVNTGAAFQVWPLPPDRVQLGRDKASNLAYVVTDDTGQRVVLSPKDVIHIALMGDGIVGRSPISLGRQSIGLGLATEETGSSLFGNGVMPSGVLKHPGELSEKAQRNLKAQKLDKQTGPGRNRRVLILEQGMEWQQIGIPPEDAQFLETRTFQIQEIARWFGVPPHMLADNTQAHFNNSAQQRAEFVQFTIRHYLVRIEQELDRKLFPTSMDMVFKFDVQGLLRGDLDTQATFMRKLMEMSAISPNEIREAYDLNPIGPEGDEYFLGVNLQPIKEALEPPAPPPPMIPGNAPPDDDVEEDDDTESDEDRIGEAFKGLFRDAAGRVVHKEISMLRRILKAGDDVEAALKDFYQKHERQVKETFGPVWCAIAKANGSEVDVDRGASRYVGTGKDLCLAMFREQGIEALHRFVLIWDDSRADNVAVDWLEAGNV